MSKDPRRGLYGSLKTYPVKSGTWTVPEWQNISRAQAAQMGRDLHSSSQEEASAYLDMRNAEQYNTRQGFGNCPDCLGKGDKMDAKTGSLVKCLRCNGTGKVAGEVTRTSRNLPIEIRSTGESFRARRLDQYEALDMIDHKCGPNARLMVYMLFVEERTQVDVAKTFGVTRRQVQYSLDKWLRQSLEYDEHGENDG